MFVADLFESYVTESTRQLVVLYPGRFQPFHLGHRDVFNSLQNMYGRDNVWISTSNKVELPKSPFTFTERLQFMLASGVPDDRVIQQASPYKFPEQFIANKENIIFIVALGAPDAARIPVDTTNKNGKESYFKKFTGLANCETADKHGYVVIANERKKNITLGKNTIDVSHGTEARAAWNTARNNPQLRREYLLQMFGRDDAELGRILDKIPAGLSEDIADPELAHTIDYAVGHYPNIRNRSTAFMKFVQRSLKHGLETDIAQQKKINNLTAQIEQLKKQIAATKIDEDLPPPENARKTQIAGTLGTYKKAGEIFKQHGVQGRALDFGAGLGKGTAELGGDAESYEPYPGPEFKPHYIDVTKIPDNSYERIVNLNVLNVVPNIGEHRVRDDIVRNIGRVLAPGGMAIITTRGRDVLTIKGTPGEEPMSMISKIGTYQKGFTQAELREYVQSVLGDGFIVNSVKLGPAGVVIKKKQSVDEVFNKPYSPEWEESESGSYDALVRLPDGTPLSIMFNNEGNDEWHVEFYRNNSQEVTGEGDAQRIFATVLHAIQKFIKEHKPWRLIFSASKEDEDIGHVESRAKLYDRLVQRYAAAWGYDAYNEDHGDQVTYELTRLKNVNEEAAGVGVVKNSKDPRYVMATMGDQNDVTAATLPKMMKGYKLT